jgi:hypothetical protein
MKPSLNESIVEDAALTWFGEMGYAIGHGAHMAQGESATKRLCRVRALVSLKS